MPGEEHLLQRQLSINKKYKIALQEATILCERFKRESDGGKSPIGVNNNFMTAVNNIVWRILTGKRSK